MAWTYAGDPSAVARDKVRFLIGDTDTTNQLFTDAEIAFLLSEGNSDAYDAAVRGCYALSSKFAGKSDYSKTVGDLSLSTQYGEQADRWNKQANDLAEQLQRSSPPSPTFYIDVNGDVFGKAKFALGSDRYV